MKMIRRRFGAAFLLRHRPTCLFSGFSRAIVQVVRSKHTILVIGLSHLFPFAL